MHDSIELEEFNQEKLKDFNLNRISRESKSSDPENPDIFKPTDNNFNGNDNLFESSKNGRNYHEGVDDYDEEADGRRPTQKRKPKRSSFGGKNHEFEEI